MKRLISLTTLAAFALTCALLCITPTQAKKPDTPGGGNGGNDGGGGDPGNTILVAPLDQGTYGSAQDINDLREVVGNVFTESGDHSTAAYWSVVESNEELVSSLTILPDGHNAYAINNSGEIVGESFDSSGNIVAVYWPDSSSSAIELPSLPDHDVSVALSINNDGMICGYVSINVLDASGEPIPGTSDGPSNRAVIWRVVSSNGTPVITGPFELPSDGDGTSSSAHALNDNDEFGIAQVVGYRRSAVSGEGGPFRWEVQSHDDGTVSVSSVVSLGDGNPSAINNSGLICGRLVGRSPSDVDALVWSGDTVSFLDRGKGRNKVAGARARDIGDTGIIVGEAGDNLLLDSRACFWDGIDGSLTYLDAYLEADSPLVGLDRANAVNAFGDIVGVGWTSAFIAIPVSQ